MVAESSLCNFLNLLIYSLNFKINFPGASTQTPQGCLPPASQERGIRPNLATLGASLRDASIGECTLNDSIFVLRASLLRHCRL